MKELISSCSLFRGHLRKQGRDLTSSLLTFCKLTACRQTNVFTGRLRSRTTRSPVFTNFTAVRNLICTHKMMLHSGDGSWCLKLNILKINICFFQPLVGWPPGASKYCVWLVLLWTRAEVQRVVERCATESYVTLTCQYEHNREIQSSVLQTKAMSTLLETWQVFFPPLSLFSLYVYGCMWEWGRGFWIMNRNDQLVCWLEMSIPIK